MSVWGLRWHFTNKSVTGTPCNIKVTVCHTAGHYGEEYDDWNSDVFRWRWNCSSDGAEWTDGERAFHARAAATGKARSPSMVRRVDGTTTGAALLENNEAFAKLTTANGETFTWAQPVSVTNHARSISDWRAVMWLVTETGWARRKRSAICGGKLCEGFIIFEQCCPRGCAVHTTHHGAVVSSSVSTWFHTTWTGGTASRLYMCKSVCTTSVDVEALRRRRRKPCA